MKKGIHPQLHEVTARCATCGSAFPVESTATELDVTLCSNCHPFYTGKQKNIDAGGRVDRFMKKFNIKNDNVE